MRLPLTEKPLGGNWGQTEYVFCVQHNIGFTDHGEWWHYFFREEGRCASIFKGRWATEFSKEIEHTFTPDPLYWMNQCKQSIVQMEKQKK